MDFLDISSFLINLISLIAILISIHAFFRDKFRRWLFFGYKPTAVIVITDTLTNKVLLIKRNMVRNVKRDYPWHFPQGGIYSSNISDAVNTILKREFKLESSMYDFEKTIALGTKKIKERKVYTKYHFGSFSLFSSLKGKGYVCCVVYADLKNAKKKIKLGYGLDELQIVDFTKALALIDPQKAQMLQKVSNQIFNR